MVGMEGLGILDDTGEVASASCAWHLPGQDVGDGAVLGDVILYAWLDH